MIFRPRSRLPAGTVLSGSARLAVGLGLAMALGFDSAAAQQVRSAVQPDTVTVGEVARAAVRIDLPPGWWIVLPDSLELGADLESAGPHTVRADTLPDRSRSLTVVYPVTAWRPGRTELPVLRLTAGGPQGDREVEVAFPALQVRSVLPAGAADPQPRPLKDVLGPNRALLPLVLLGAFAILLIAGWLWRRARRRTAPPLISAGPPVPPRDAALAALDRARAAGLIETGRMKAFYSAVAEALRVYLDALDPRWGAELTTSELRERLAAEIDADALAELVRVLTTADMVKFAKRHVLAETAARDWAAARGWVERFEPAVPAGDHGFPAPAAPAAETQGAA